MKQFHQHLNVHYLSIGFALAICVSCGNSAPTTQDDDPSMDEIVITNVSDDNSIIATPTSDSSIVYHTVSFDCDGFGQIEDQMVQHGDKASKPDDPSRDGYHLTGWMYQGETWSFSGYVVTTDMVLTAAWEPNEYTITKINGADEATQTIKYDSTYKLGSTTKDGYHFVGWFSEECCNGKKYTDENGNSLTKFNELSDITLYAGFAYDISFNTNGGNPIDSVTLNEGEALDTEITAVRNDDDFNGWYLDSSFEQPFSSNEPLGGDHTLYARWNNETSPDYLDYRMLSDGTLEIVGVFNTVQDLVIPKYINGVVVSSIGSGAFENSRILQSVTFDEGIYSIGSQAFNNCSSLTAVNYRGSLLSWLSISGKANLIEGVHLFLGGDGVETVSVVIPDGISSISDSEFYGCSSIESVVIPDSVTSIGNNVFAGCSSIKSLEVPFIGGNNASPQTIGYLFGTQPKTNIPSPLESVVLGDNCLSIVDDAFYRCGSLTQITIGNNVTSIGDYAFYKAGLTSIIIPGNVTYIGCYAFDGCSSLSSVTIQTGVETIDGGAFYGCSNLTSITIPNSVTAFGGGIFRDCFSLETVTLPFTERTIAELFGYYTSIGEWQDNSAKYSLKEIILSGDWPYIPDRFLGGCKKLESLTIPDGTSSIGIYAFYDCKHLASIVIPDSVETIGIGAFMDCSNLESVIIPESVTTIGDNAFKNCTSLKSIVIPDSVTSIGKDAFNNCASLESITLPFVGGSATENQTLKYLFTNVPTSLEEVILSNQCTSIPEKAFYQHSRIKSVNIPESVTSIGDYAFYYCSGLTSIVIPEGVTSIGREAFRACIRIEQIAIPASVISIGNQAFEGCKASSVIILATNVSIGYRTFYFIQATTVYCVVSSKPSNWDAFWVANSATVVWGYSPD